MGPVLVVVVVLGLVVPVVLLPFLLPASGDLSVETGPVLVVVVLVWVPVVVPPLFVLALVVTLNAIVPYVVAELLCSGTKLIETGMRAENKWTKKKRESERTNKGRIEKR